MSIIICFIYGIGCLINQLIQEQKLKSKKEVHT